MKDYEFELINEFVTEATTEEEFIQTFNQILLRVILQKEFGNKAEVLIK